MLVAAWLTGSGLAHINEVTLCPPRLVLGWVTVSGFSSRRGTFILIHNQPPKSTQPDHPFMRMRDKYQPKGGDALQLGSKDRYGSYVWQVKLCDPLVTHGPYPSALEIKGL